MKLEKLIAMIPYSKLPFFVKVRVGDYGDFSDAFDQRMRKFCQREDIVAAKAWESLGEDRQRQIVSEIKIEMQKQLKEIENL